MSEGYTATEKQLMDALIDTAQTMGYQVMHIPDKLYALAAKEGRYDALSGAKGFVDILAVGYGVLFAIEVKDQSGRTATEQDAWVDAFAAVSEGICSDCKARVFVMVARPEDQDYIMDLMAFYREHSWKETA